MNPGCESRRGSFVYAGIRKGLRAVRLSAAGRENAGANAESPTPVPHRARRAESSLFLSLTDPIQLAMRVALDPDGNQGGHGAVNWRCLIDRPPAAMPSERLAQAG